MRKAGCTAALALMVGALVFSGSSVAFATTVKYDFNGTLQFSGATVTGFFNYDPATHSVYNLDFSFSLPTVLPHPVEPPSSYVLSPSDAIGYQTGSHYYWYNYSLSDPYFTQVALDMSSGPGGILTMTGGDLVQYPNVGGANADFGDIFLLSKSSLTATPIPSTLALFIGGLGLLGLVCLRKTQKASTILRAI